MTLILIFSTFLASLVSGWHCALMCGGVASWAESQVVRVISPRKMLFEQLIMHLCRILTYVILGGLAGFVGSLVWAQDILPIQRALFVLAASFLLLNAWRLLWGARSGRVSPVLSWVERQIGSLWVRIIPQKIEVEPSSNWVKRVSIGLVWGLIPCGLVYSVLPLALLSGDALTGMAIMGAMGLGTLPNLLIISGLLGRIAAHLVQLGHERWTRYVAALLMALAGTFGLYRAFTLADEFLKGGFCFS